MQRFIAHVFAALLVCAPAASLGQGSPDAGSQEESKADAGDEEGESASSDSSPDHLPATQLASLLGLSWSARSGCQGDWKGKWKVSGGTFSLVPGGASGASGAAFHAVCNSYRSVGPYASPKVAVTLLGGVIHRVAILHGGGSSEEKSKMTRYFESVCDSSRAADEGTRYDTVYESCGGFDAGLNDSDSNLSLYFFADESVFRSRMNALPMPTK